MSKGRMQQAQRRERRHAAQVARRIEKKREKEVRAEDVSDEETLDLEEGDELEALAPVEEEADETEDPAAEEPEEVEPVRKDMGAMAMPPMMMGPTSFAEMDQQRLEQERAHAVRETTWDVEDMVRNIMANPSFDTAAKSKAIQALGKDFGARVSAIMSSDMPDDVAEGMSKSLDMDMLYTEAVLAADDRHLSAQERVSDWISLSKEALSYGAKKAKGDEAYALVYTDKSGNKVRKYLIHDKAHVRNALARAAQMMKRGGTAAEDARKALPKIHAAAKKMGIGMGKSNDANALVIEKDASGTWRWVGWASNNFKDRQQQILAKEAHEDYVRWLDANPDMAPMFMTWHLPGTARKNPVDFWSFEKGFLILSGKLEETEAAGLLKAATVTDLGLSVAGLGLSEPGNANVITKYRLAEVSDLPLENAANPFTGFTMFAKEADMDKLKYLAELMGKDAAQAFIEKTGLKQEELNKAGVEQKAVTPPAEEPKAPAAPAAAPTADQQTLVSAVLKELDAEGLNAFVLQAKEAMEKVPVLEAVIKEMQGNQEQKLAEQISPPAAKWAWASEHRASQADETKIEKESKLAKSLPELGENWLNQITNTQPMSDAEMAVK